MCGIAGAVRIGDRELVEQMTEMLAFRGPDDSGVYENGDVRLGHRRLSIIDLSAAGHQPMVSDDGQLAIVYNGEIYNFLQLRAELQKKGRHFHSDSDTEVILVAYQEYGIECLDRLDGIFAFALWDESQSQLLLARDALGVKPLFYYMKDGGIAFASELKALCLVPGLKRRVNRRALRSALRFACNLSDESMLASVHKLMPGEFLLWREGNCRVNHYWRHPEPAPAAWDEDQAVAALRDRLSHAVVSQMVSDAPLGAALSGGLDSSCIVAMMAESGKKVETFTVGHGEDDPDLINARIVAEHCHTNHHEIQVQAENVADLLPAVVWHLEEPLGQMEAVQMYINYREAAKFVKVLLVGEGADECFAGYDRYKLFNPRLPLPLAWRKHLYQRFYMYADQQPPGLAGLVARTFWGRLPGSPMLDPHPRADEPVLEGNCGRSLELALNHDQRTYLHHLALKRADATGMAHSLELRVPFLAREIVELAARMPASLMLKDGIDKYVLRQAAARLLPATIANRPKRPFQMRLGTGLVETLEMLCDRLLAPPDVRARGFFDPARVERLRRGRPGQLAPYVAHKVWSYRLWSMILCELWARLFLDRVPSKVAPQNLAELL